MMEEVSFRLGRVDGCQCELRCRQVTHIYGRPEWAADTDTSEGIALRVEETAFYGLAGNQTQFASHRVGLGIGLDFDDGIKLKRMPHGRHQREHTLPRVEPLDLLDSL